MKDLNTSIPSIGLLFELSHLTASCFFKEIPTIIFPFLSSKSVSDLSNSVAPLVEASFASATLSHFNVLPLPLNITVIGLSLFIWIWVFINLLKSASFCFPAD
jgi:hypothetical protein